MRFQHIRYAKHKKTVLGFIAINGRKTILLLEDSDELVDPGFYHLVPHNGTKFKNTWCLIGANTSHFPEPKDTYENPDTSKTTILYHGGDTHEDTIGCALVGHRFHFNGTTPDIDGAAEAMNLLRVILSGDGPHYVNIKEEYGK